MSNFTLKLFYSHRVDYTPAPGEKSTIPGDKAWIYTTRLYQCDYVAVMDLGRTIMVTGFMNNGSRVVDETVYPYADSCPEGRSKRQEHHVVDYDPDREICTKAVVENANGKTTQVVKVDENN